ncbi:hypothetical protein C8F04DRAFT_1109525 [Mycena alexandri]|uniref:Uncharacterized protein n=1 Tax=Mycena alexandri TaxID=1745969 RepID=A0AAD6SQD3_9AGAR|nr:hypothetical protein C8F04DRAFT_1109525 [Mycena alexandri]
MPQPLAPCERIPCHSLALEQLRYTDHAYQPVPTHERLCRFCIAAVENPEHALLECRANLQMADCRNVFLEKLLHAVQSMQNTRVELNSIRLLKAMIYERSIIVFGVEHNLRILRYLAPPAV